MAERSETQDGLGTCAPAGNLPALLFASLADTRALFSGPERGRRWKALALLAVMAGVVGAGAAPPPLGLLAPLWTDPQGRAALAANAWLAPVCLFLALFLTGMAAVARAFSLALVNGIRTTAPRAGDYRRHLGRGAAHFFWSSALTIPLYLLLFAGEALVTHGVYGQLLSGAAELTEAQILALLLTAGGQFALVLAPWTVLTLPAMALMYELTPAAMVLEDCGPVRACALVLGRARKAPGRFAGYLGLRVLLQVAGNAAAAIALLPCLLITAALTAPLTVGGWALSRALGGLATSGGAAVWSTAVLVTLVVLYCLLCSALVPVAVLLNAFALNFVRRGGHPGARER